MDQIRCGDLWVNNCWIGQNTEEGERFMRWVWITFRLDSFSLCGIIMVIMIMAMAIHEVRFDRISNSHPLMEECIE